MFIKLWGQWWWWWWWWWGGWRRYLSSLPQHAYALELLHDQLYEGAKALDVGSGSGILSVCFARMVSLFMSWKSLEPSAFSLVFLWSGPDKVLGQNKSPMQREREWKSLYVHCQKITFGRHGCLRNPPYLTRINQAFCFSGGSEREGYRDWSYQGTGGWLCK